MNELILIAIMAVTILALIIVINKMVGQHQKLVRDLTAKIMSKDVMEYRLIQEDQPPKAEKDKRKKPVDPTLGTDY